MTVNAAIHTDESNALTHIDWNTSVLHLDVLKSFWPGKFNAFASIMLHDAALLLTHHLAARQTLTDIAIPPYHVPANTVHVHLADVNPDKDVVPTGA